MVSWRQFWRRDEDPFDETGRPTNVRAVCPDGTEIPMLVEPMGLDRDGKRLWGAYGPAFDVLPRGSHIAVETLPPRAVIVMRLIQDPTGQVVFAPHPDFVPLDDDAYAGIPMQELLGTLEKVKHDSDAWPPLPREDYLAGALMLLGLFWASLSLAMLVPVTTESVFGLGLAWLTDLETSQATIPPWISVPLFYLLAALPVFVLTRRGLIERATMAQELRWRLGAEHQSWPKRLANQACSALLHPWNLVLPLSVAICLAGIDLYYLRVYLRTIDQTGDHLAAVAAATRRHVAFIRVTMVVVAAAAVAAGTLELFAAT